VEKVRGVFLMPSNGKNATNFFPHLIFRYDYGLPLLMQDFFKILILLTTFTKFHYAGIRQRYKEYFLKLVDNTAMYFYILCNSYNLSQFLNLSLIVSEMTD